MIHGVSARMLERYLITTNDAMNRAAEVHNRDPFADIIKERERHQQMKEEQRQARLVFCRESGTYFDPFEGSMIKERQHVPFPQIARPNNHRHPFAPENAFGGRHSLGVGNSSNIVVDAGLHEEISRKLDMVDDDAGADIHKTSMLIEEMCSSMYVVPETSPRVRAIADRVKSALGEFRSITEDANIDTRKFVNEMGNIDQSDHMFTIVLEERSVNEVINNVHIAMGQQANNMKTTMNGYWSAAQGLRQQANAARHQAQSFRQSIQQLRTQLNGIKSRMSMNFTPGASGFSSNQDMREFYRQMRELERQMRDAERQMMSRSNMRF